MNKLSRLTEKVLSLLTEKGAQKAYCTARSTETVEFNVDGGEFSLMRTLFDNALSMTAVKDGKKGSVGSNSFEDGAVNAAVNDCLQTAESSQSDPAWDIAPGCGEKHFSSGAAEPDMNLLFDRTAELCAYIGEKHPAIVIEQMIVCHKKSRSVYRNSNGTAFFKKSGCYSVELMFSAHEGELSSSFFSSGVITDSLERPFIELGSISGDLSDVERQIHTVPCPEKFVGTMLLTPGCLDSFINDIAGNFASDRPLLDGTSIWLDKLGKEVCDERISISVAPRCEKIVCGESYTGEGFISENYDFIRRGRLESFMTSLYVANKTGLPRAANSSSSYIMEAGDTPLEDIIRGIDRGILVGRFSGGEPGINGDFSGVAKNSFLIEKGKIVGAAAETMISGNLAQMLTNLRAISKERVEDGCTVLPWAAFDGITVSGK